MFAELARPWVVTRTTDWQVTEHQHLSSSPFVFLNCSLRVRIFFPAKQVALQRLQHSHFNRGHHDHQGQGRGENLIGSYQVRGLAQPVSHAARRTDGLGDQGDAPAKAERETRAGEKIRKYGG